MITSRKKPVFVTPFSSQKTTNEDKLDKGQSQAKTPKETSKIPRGSRAKTPAGTFFFPVSSSRLDKIQHVTPMTKNKIKQGLCKAIAACPSTDPDSPALTFLAISQATTVGGQSQEKSKTDQPYKETEDNPVTDSEHEEEPSYENDVDADDDDVYDYNATPAATQTMVNKHKKIKCNKKLLDESVKQEVLKSIFKMHQEIMEIQERRKALAMEIAGDQNRKYKKQRTGVEPFKGLLSTVEVHGKPTEASKEE